MAIMRSGIEIPPAHRSRDREIQWHAEDLDRERSFMGKQWSKREAQILAAVDSTVGMVGDLQGIAGKAMPEIPSLDMPLLEASTDREAKVS